MTIRFFLQKPFIKDSFKVYGQALSASVVLVPLLAVLLVNQNIESAGLFFVGLIAYFAIFITVGWRFELRRARQILGKTLPVKFSFGGSFAYAWLNILLGTFTSILTIVWAITLVRNILLYPFAEWGHPYPDLAWGGPTWQGAIALHTGSAIVSIFIMPWLLSWLVMVQATLISKLLVKSTS